MLTSRRFRGDPRNGGHPREPAQASRPRPAATAAARRSIGPLWFGHGDPATRSPVEWPMLPVSAWLLALVAAAGASHETVVTVIGLSDYHSHALPFRSEGRPDRGGIARTIAFIKKERAAGPTLVLSGGDTLNQGAPAWSDEYRCVEWPWLT